jgi:hypothetical protein
LTKLSPEKPGGLLNEDIRRLAVDSWVSTQEIQSARCKFHISGSQIKAGMSAGIGLRPIYRGVFLCLQIRCRMIWHHPL